MHHRTYGGKHTAHSRKLRSSICPEGKRDDRGSLVQCVMISIVRTEHLGHTHTSSASALSVLNLNVPKEELITGGSWFLSAVCTCYPV